MKPNRDIRSRAAQKAERALASAVAALDDPAGVHALLVDLCTPAELQALADRWQVACLLDQGLAYREIQARTGVSVTTVGRVARFLESGAGGYRAALDAIH